MIFYFIWIPALIVLTALWAWMARQVNLNPSSLYFYVIFLAIPVWPFIARLSKNLMFDGMMYDFIMTIAYTLTFVFMGTGQNFNFIQWVGVFLSLVGLILMKVQ